MDKTDIRLIVFLISLIFVVITLACIEIVLDNVCPDTPVEEVKSKPELEIVPMPSQPPSGWYIVQSTLTKKFAACYPGGSRCNPSCDTYQEAVNVAWRQCKYEEKSKEKYWQKVVPTK